MKQFLHPRSASSLTDLPHDGERWCQCLEASYGKTGRSGDELDEESLLLVRQLGQDLVEELHRLRLLRKSVIRATSFRQHFQIPRLSDAYGRGQRGEEKTCMLYERKKRK